MQSMFRILSSTLLSLILTTLASPASAQLGSQSTDLVYYPVTPCRIIDTRNPGVLSGILQAGTTRDFYAWNPTYESQGGVTTNCNMLQNTNNAAVVLNLTTVATNAGGFITAYPADQPKPGTSTLNFAPNSIIGNNATLKINQTGSGYSFKVTSTANVHLIADVVGYYARPVATAIECTNVISAGVDLLPGTSLAVYSPQCSAGYTVMSGLCYRTSGTTGGNHNTYAFGPTSNTHATNPSAFYCGMNNSHATETSNVNAGARCCRIPGR